MKNTIPCIALAAGLFLNPTPASADLPQLKEQPYLGYFIGIEHKRKMRFGVSSKGRGVIEPLNDKGKPVVANVPFLVNFEVVETLPDGKTIRKKLNPDTLTSDQEATLDPRKPVTFRGMVPGDAAFEVTVYPESGGVSVSGKLTDKGTLTNPLHFEISLNLRPYPRKPSDEEAKIKMFEERAEKDVLKFETVSRKRGKIEFLDETNPATVVGEAMSKLDFKTDGFNNHVFEIETTDKAKLTFADTGELPIWNGFALHWRIDEGADDKTQKLTIKAK